MDQAGSDVEIVVVAYRSGDTLKGCLDSALAQLGTRPSITVVNNDPGDLVPRSLARERDATCIEVGANIGFCGAVNRAIAESRRRYVMLLNPDAVLAPDYVERLVQHMEDHPEIASVGGRIMRGEPGDARFVDSTGIAVGRGRKASDIGHGAPDDGRRSGIDEPFGVTGAAAIYRRTALDEVAVKGQVLPESFFMYLDDVDLAWRLRLGGYRCVVDHAALAWHRRASAGDRERSETGLRRLTHKISWEASRPDYVRERSWVNHLLMLVRNDDAGSFLEQFAFYAARRVPGDLFGLVQRPAMALRMRRHFLELLPGALDERREIQARRVVSAAEMARWLP